MSRYFYELAARDRVADWRREADLDRLLEQRPRRARARAARLVALARLPFGRGPMAEAEPIAEPRVVNDYG